MPELRGFANIDGEFVGALIYGVSNRPDLMGLVRDAPQLLWSNPESQLFRPAIAVINSTLILEGGMMSPHTKILQYYRKSIGAHIGFLLLDNLSRDYAHEQLGLTGHSGRPDEKTRKEATAQLHAANGENIGRIARRLTFGHVHNVDANQPKEVARESFPGVAEALADAHRYAGQGSRDQREIAALVTGAEIAIASFALDLREREADYSTDHKT